MNLFKCRICNLDLELALFRPKIGTKIINTSYYPRALQQSVIGAVTMKCFVVLALALAAASAVSLFLTRKYLLPGYILDVLTHTTAWDRLWGGDETLK